MKKLSFLVITLCVIGLLGSCASNGAVAAGTGVQSQRVDLPTWYTDPPLDSNIYGIGSGKSQLGQFDVSEGLAENAAYNSLAQQLEAFVDRMRTNYVSEGGAVGDMASSRMFEDVSRQLASAVIRSSKIAKRTQSNDGTVFFLVALPDEVLKDTVKGTVETASSKEASIKRDAALKSMDEALKAKGKPEPVNVAQ